jgi:hypothetical protein
MALEMLCQKWLERFGHFDVTVKVKGVLERSQIDIDLGLIGVEFDFYNSKGWLGDATAFFHADKVLLNEAALYPQKARAEA